MADAVTRVSRPDDIRRHNLALLLGSIHRFGPLTRAELTVQLGLNRSTVGVLVAELDALGILEEAVPAREDRGQRAAGRPSHVVRPRTDGPYGIAVDVDVDRLTSAAVQVGGGQLAHRVTRLPARVRSASEVTRWIAREVTEIVQEVQASTPHAWPIGVGVSIPGTVRTAEGVVEAAPNLQWWDQPVGSTLAELLPDLPVALANDADLGVLAEHLRGAARDATHLVYLNGKVGVGAGILVGGRPLAGAGGLAGEIGHTVLDPTGPPCHCGGRGCVENYIGETAILQLSGRTEEPNAESVAAVMAAAEAGEPAAVKGIHCVADSLGKVLANLVNVLNPQVIVLGGALSDVFRIAQPQVMAALDLQAMSAARRMVEIRISGLYGESSLVGAGELSLRPLLADPAAVAGGTSGNRAAAPLS
jgi:predicted NBD/HSP70 family sugar kinase